MAKTGIKRLFISLNIPVAAKNHLINEVRRLDFDNSQLRLVRLETLHITVRFLGDCDAAEHRKITACLKNINSGQGGADFRVDKVDAFPVIYRPRVLVFKCSQAKGPVLLEVVKKLNEDLAQAGFPRENKTWQPHITFGRVKQREFIMPDTSLFEPIIFTVNTIDLMESHLSSQGARHKLLESYEL